MTYHIAKYSLLEDVDDLSSADLPINSFIAHTILLSY